ncbi:hypothetical protein AWC19_13580 [Mycobacterium palustre]|uniref:Uncharacterized protein n=1 Tax=Mycobacterium palustre TaxID=153971 RepID=A0A1X1ZEY4_9MYCO|nr:hypothetical protein AWC19_13580 [Mycobacterium palustre]
MQDLLARTTPLTDRNSGNVNLHRVAGLAGLASDVWLTARLGVAFHQQSVDVTGVDSSSLKQCINDLAY